MVFGGGNKWWCKGMVGDKYYWLYRAQEDS